MAGLSRPSRLGMQRFALLDGVTGTSPVTTKTNYSSNRAIKLGTCLEKTTEACHINHANE